MGAWEPTRSDVAQGGLQDAIEKIINGLQPTSSSNSTKTVFAGTIEAGSGGKFSGASGAAPGIANGAAVGTGSAPSISGSDVRGAVTFNVNTGTATGVLITVTFNVAYASAPFVLLTPANAAAGGLSTQIPFVASTSTTFTLNANGVTVPNGTYVFNYFVIQ